MRSQTVIGVRVLLCEPLGNCIHFSLSPRYCDSWLQLGQNPNVMAASALGYETGLAAYGDPDLRLGVAHLKTVGHHSENGIALAAEVDGLSHYSRVRGESPLPQGIADDGSMLVRGLIFVWGEIAPKDWCDAEHLEVVSRHSVSPDLLWRAAAGHAEAAPLLYCDCLFEQVVLGLPVAEIRG